ncbi:MAG: hypothetical protein AAGC74_00210 [Verrucomicrobiota bacterium]
MKLLLFILLFVPKSGIAALTFLNLNSTSVGGVDYEIVTSTGLSVESNGVDFSLVDPGAQVTISFGGVFVDIVLRPGNTVWWNDSQDDDMLITVVGTINDLNDPEGEIASLAGLGSSQSLLEFSYANIIGEFGPNGNDYLSAEQNWEIEMRVNLIRFERAQNTTNGSGFSLQIDPSTASPIPEPTTSLFIFVAFLAWGGFFRYRT